MENGLVEVGLRIPKELQSRLEGLGAQCGLTAEQMASAALALATGREKKETAPCEAGPTSEALDGKESEVGAWKRFHATERNARIEAESQLFNTRAELAMAQDGIKKLSELNKQLAGELIIEKDEGARCLMDLRRQLAAENDWSRALIAQRDRIARDLQSEKELSRALVEERRMLQEKRDALQEEVEMLRRRAEDGAQEELKWREAAEKAEKACSVLLKAAEHITIEVLNRGDSAPPMIRMQDANYFKMAAAMLENAVDDVLQCAELTAVRREELEARASADKAIPVLTDLNIALGTEDLVEKMVDRFLVWPLPEEFSPSCGIAFVKSYQNMLGMQTREPGTPWWPVGTNLFGAVQAEQMVRHMLDGLQVPVQQYAEDAMAQAIERTCAETQKRTREVCAQRFLENAMRCKECWAKDDAVEVIRGDNA